MRAARGSQGQENPRQDPLSYGAVLSAVPELKCRAYLKWKTYSVGREHVVPVGNRSYGRGSRFKPTNFGLRSGSGDLKSPSVSGGNLHLTMSGLGLEASHAPAYVMF